MYGKIRIEHRKVSGNRPAVGEKLGFGQRFSDHMFIMDYSEDKGWHDPRIVPYGPFVVDPSAKVFHYGQSTFEGMKAFRSVDGSILLFRPEESVRRMNRSNDRMGMPLLDEGFFLKALRQLVAMEADWVPMGAGASLYIRPFMFATEPSLGVRVSSSFRFAIILSPVEGYFDENTTLKPINIYVEDQYVRAIRGGTGEAKTSGNYAAGMKAQALAKQKGCDQVLWLDGVERKYVEEVGNMNVFFLIDGTIVTPKLGGGILAGITRDSVIRMLNKWGMPVEERNISIAELMEAGADGRLLEAFGTGTAAVICPIGRLVWNGVAVEVGNRLAGPVSRKLYDEITGIQTGSIADEFGWTVPVIVDGADH